MNGVEEGEREGEEHGVVDTMTVEIGGVWNIGAVESGWEPVVEEVKMARDGLVDGESATSSEGQLEPPPRIFVVGDRIPVRRGERVRKVVTTFEKVPKKKWVVWGNCGCERVCGRTNEKEIQMVKESKGQQGRVLGMKFQVAEVKKPLMSFEW